MRLLMLLFSVCLTLSIAACSVFEQDYDGAGAAANGAKGVAFQAKDVFSFEAESGQIVARGTNTWTLETDEDASGKQIFRKVGGDFYPESKSGPGVVWSYAAESDATYDIWIRVKPNAQGDSLFFEWAGDSRDYHWPADTLGQWVWSKLRSVEVREGQNYEFAVWAREDLIEIDQVIMQSAGAIEPSQPSQPDVTTQ